MARTKKNNKTLKKENFPSKICATCGLPFQWRKKWKDCWDEVKYCSEACRRNKSGAKLNS